MVWNRLGLVIVAFTFMAGNGNPLSAQNPANQGKNKNNKNQQNPVSVELHSAKQLLESANHDYAGHRANAAHEVSLALHQINHPGGAQGQKPNGGNGGNGANAGKKNGNNPAKAKNNAKVGQGKMTEPQAVSDAQLKQAAQIITVAMGQLPPAQVQAKTHLQSALREISTALTIR